MTNQVDTIRDSLCAGAAPAASDSAHAPVGSGPSFAPADARLLELCVALTAEHDREALLSRILDTAMDLAGCDAGTLYLLEDGALHFCRLFTRSQGVRQGGHDDPVELPPVPLEDAYLCGRCARRKERIRVDNVYADDRFDFSGTRRYDEMTGYRTRSMMVLPMENEKGRLIGVLQLINAMDGEGRTAAFDPALEPLLTALASQAAISLAAMQYTDQINTLLDSLVQAFSRAIDERSHYTANHTKTMAAIGDRFLDWLATVRPEKAMAPEKRKAFRMAVLLHDAGKLAIPLQVMDKATRLADRLADIEERFRVMGLLDRLAQAQGLLPEADAGARAAEREQALERIRRADRAGFLPDDELAALAAIAQRTFTDETGAVRPWLTPEEAQCLSIRKGTLTDGERASMQSHVAVTERILEQITFPEEYADVPAWASAHHEFLNGTGYTHRLSGPDIPREARLLTILDIFEALTAKDRPYKAPMPVEKALSVLEDMAAHGCLDPDLLALFRESRAWEGVL